MPKKLTTEEFIEKAKSVHGNKYGYSLVEYKNSYTKIKIVCQVHGIFEQIPSYHLGGSCCPYCCGLYKTTEIFIEKMKQISGNKYDYSLVEYKKGNEKIKIICKKHGVFEQTASNHLSGQGCPNCSKNKKLDTKTFIKKAKIVHGDRYDYSLVDYKCSTSKIKIICKTHGVFEQNPNSHLNGNGCSMCCGTKKLNTNEFIKRAKEIHGNKYDYSLIDYINSTTKVKIICPEHGVFEQQGFLHLSGRGCKKCSRIKAKIKQSISKLSTTKEFIQKAKMIHGNIYNYSKVVYIKCSNKITIICPIHGEFQQTPSNHLCGSKCPKCTMELFKKKITPTKDVFIKKVKKIHGDKYDYSKVIYINNKIKVCIICPKHGEFYMSPVSHLNSGCPKCARELRRLTTEEFIKKVNILHNNKYDYSKVKYINNTTKVIIGCKIHGYFEQAPMVHLDKSGCPYCCGMYKTTEDVINEFKNVHGERYDYSLVNFIKTADSLDIICREHGIFKQTYSSHKNGANCPRCNHIRKSDLEWFVNDLLIENKIKFIREKTFDWLIYKKNLFLDFYLPEQEIVIEVQGEQHFHPTKKYGGMEELLIRQERDKTKLKLCTEHGLEMIYIDKRTTTEEFEEIIKRIKNKQVETT